MWLSLMKCCPSGCNIAHVKGLTFVLTTAVIWVAASFVVQDIDQDLGALTLTYIANSLFSLYLPIFVACVRWQEKLAHPAAIQGNHTDNATSMEREGLVSSQVAGGSSADRYSTKDTLRAAAVVAPLWFFAQFTFNLSLSLTSVSSNTVLSSASSLFTFLGSVLVLGEKYTSQKLLSVIFCVAGTVCVGVADFGGTSGKGSVQGDLLTLTSSMFYAAYTLAISHYLPRDEALGMSQFFGFMGLIIMLSVGPLVLILQIQGVLELQSVQVSSYGWTLVKGLFDNVLTDYLWARAVILIGPTAATLGLSVQIPIAIIMDLMVGRSTVMHSTSSLVLNTLGAILIICGFAGINMSTWPGLEAACAWFSVPRQLSRGTSPED